MEYKPKAFISHDSRDNERFVIDFAKKLRKKHVDAWVDKWELEPGDSLPKEIFESIDETDIFISIISKNSINSKWVKEELEAGFIRKIEEGLKFIPIIIDENIKIFPHCKHVLQVRIKDLDNYNDKFKIIINTIFDISEKPSLGKPPKYAFENHINGLNKTDTVILKELGNYLINNPKSILDFEDVCELLKDYDLSKNTISESLECLASMKLLSSKPVCSSPYPERNTLTYNGIILYGKHYEKNFDNILKDVVSSILNNSYYEISIINNEDKYIGYKYALLEFFEDKGYLENYKTCDGTIRVKKINGFGIRNLKSYL
ncbi:MAG: toll/interleukin-1 receptor domain-containing protein [Methanosphaera stadtmanae]|nr:toll/interleukin-1 receptor domain-containing protein [Methanosphaera stadtmanae]